VFGAIFEVNSRFGKLWYFLGHFDKKIQLIFNIKYYDVEEVEPLESDYLD